MRYVVRNTHYDATRPWSVVDDHRSFNRVIASYATREQAAKRRRDMEKRAGTGNPDYSAPKVSHA